MKNLLTHFQHLTVLSLLFTLNSFNTFATTIYVNSAAVGSNNGTSWVNAYTLLSSALATASVGDEIWVAGGIYKPTIAVDINSNGIIDAREVTFQVPSGVALYGGFSGTEVSVMDRNWTLNPTILSGDIDNNDINADANGIDESTDDIQGNNAYHVVYTVNVSIDTRLDGFIITAGSADVPAPLADPNRHGGGWYNRLNAPSFASSSTIVNTIFQGNYAKSKGGAIHNKQSPAGAEIISLVQNCKFIENKSDSSGGAIFLGSYLPGNYQPHFVKCEFTGNTAYRNGGALTMIGDRAIIDSTLFTNNTVTVISMDGTTLPGSGGGALLSSSNATLTGCIFKQNKATGNPTGAFEGGGGGAVYISSNDPQTTALGASEPKFVGCGFYNNIASDNTAAWGGAVVNMCDAGILAPSFINCVFNGNTAQTNGGAIASFTRVISEPESFTSSITPLFTNCTFTGNSAIQRGGAIFNDGYVFMGSEIMTSVLENCILWNNTAGSEGNEIFKTGNNIIVNSLIKGSGGSGGAWNSSLGTDGGNNIDEDPQFVNAASPLGIDTKPATTDDGLALSGSSPALNVGNNSATGLSGISLDYTGNQRIRNSTVDMGAYERIGIKIPELDIYRLKDWRLYRPCLSCPPPWAILFFDNQFRQFRWVGSAQLVDDGKTATITGNIVNVKDRKAGFTVRIKLINASNWENWSAQKRIYFTLSPEVWKLAYKEHKNWTYWELSDESYLEGTGAIEGKVYLKHQPANYLTGFQLGKGANALDKDTGMYGGFCYQGSITYNSKPLNMKGFGSLNTDAEFCSDCEVQIPDKSTITSNLTYNSTLKSLGNELNFEIFPIPANDVLYILPQNMFTTELIVNVYNTNGQIRKQEKLTLHEGQYKMNVNDLQPGVYIMNISSPNGSITNKRLIIN